MKIDPVTVEVIRNALNYTAEEMGIALKNSAYSHNIKERMDHSCAIFDPSGNLLAQAEHIPVHLGSLPWGAKNVLRYLEKNKESWEKEDMVMVNDPYVIGTHLNDLSLIKPIFFDERLIGFCINKAHHVDVGGQSPGSISTDATSLFQEGVVIPPVKLISRGKMNQNLLEDFIKKVRNPKTTKGDLRAQIASNNLGVKRIIELANRKGDDILSLAFTDIISYGEKRMRERLKIIPEGIYRAEDCLEDIGDSDSLTWIRVTLKRDEDLLSVSFKGTDPEVNSPFNAVFGVTLSSTYFAIKSIVDPEAPMNEGVLKPIKAFAPEGSLVNPKRPAPVSGGNLETSQRIVDTVFKALSQALLNLVPAASHGSMNNVIVGGFDPLRKRKWVFYETIGGGSGARHRKDGVDGISCNMTNTMNTPIEAIEQYYPMLFLEYELRTGTHGKGIWNGGCGIRRAWTLTGPSAEVTVLGERHKIPPWGVAGGKPGELGAYWVKKEGGKKEKIKSKTTLSLKKGDTLIIETPGGGGFGDLKESKKPNYD